jgi:hypothetical protein
MQLENEVTNPSLRQLAAKAKTIFIPGSQYSVLDVFVYLAVAVNTRLAASSERPSERLQFTSLCRRAVVNDSVFGSYIVLNHYSDVFNYLIAQ